MPGSEFKTKEAYYRGSREQRIAYHSRMAGAFRKNLKILQRRATGQTGIGGGVTDTDPVVDEDPINQEIDHLQEMFRFHSRQAHRLKRESKQQDFFSLEEENNREQKIPQTTRTGSRIVYEEISQEEYDELNDENKKKYHRRLSDKYHSSGNEKLYAFHKAMYSRLRDASNLPTFSKYKEGYKAYGKEYTKEEYLQMSDDDKIRYHNRMDHRARKNRDNNLSNWHQRMSRRLGTNSRLPTYFSPEHEAEESQ